MSAHVLSWYATVFAERFSTFLALKKWLNSPERWLRLRGDVACGCFHRYLPGLSHLKDASGGMGEDIIEVSNKTQHFNSCTYE